jgi:hypothetical protein
VIEAAVEPSADIAQAAWIADRLSPPGAGLVTSVVPAGFEAYARVLHGLAGTATGGDRPARWAQVAAWSGVELVSGSQFPDIAFPDHEPPGAEPWPGQLPQVGTLHESEAVALGVLVAGHTTTPARCWFCTWEGWGVELSSAPGPRVELPWRNYVLSVGRLAALRSHVAAQEGHTPNLWWPDDHAWCVATEIDLPWTYVGGPAALIAEILTSPQLEAQPAAPDDNHHERLPEWLVPLVSTANAELLGVGEATIHTWRGTITAQLDRPDGASDGALRIQRASADGQYRGSGWTRITPTNLDNLPVTVTGCLARALIELL